MSDEASVLSCQSSGGPIGASQRRVGRSRRISPEDGDTTSARDLQNPSPSGRDTQSVDQGEVWVTPVQRARVSQGRDGSAVGVSDLQHPSMDAAMLEKSGGGAAWVEKG